MKVINNSKLALSHDEYVLPIGAVADVPDKVAKVWLTYPGITQYVTPEDLEAEKEKAVQEAIKKIKAEEKKTATKKTTSKTKKK